MGFSAKNIFLNFQGTKFLGNDFPTAASKAAPNGTWRSARAMGRLKGHDSNQAFWLCIFWEFHCTWLYFKQFWCIWLRGDVFFSKHMPKWWLQGTTNHLCWALQIWTSKVLWTAKALCQAVRTWLGSQELCTCKKHHDKIRSLWTSWFWNIGTFLDNTLNK